jgi:hypothetical protein
MATTDDGNGTVRIDDLFFGGLSNCPSSFV